MIESTVLSRIECAYIVDKQTVFFELEATQIVQARQTAFVCVVNSERK